MPTKKLFIVGSKSTNPDNWSIWDETALVIADSPEEAIKLAPKGHTIAIEADMTKARLMMTYTEPNWGDDV